MHHQVWLWFLLAAPPQPVDFDTDIVPILTKAGCNAAACHGAAAGRGGFKLSLFGGDPARDYVEIAHRLEGRRVNLADPAFSLVVMKPTQQLDHEGGMRFDEESAASETLVRWIGEGAARRSSRTLVAMRVEPEDAVVPATGHTVPLRVTATFDDGTSRNVTGMAVYTSADPAAVEATPEGRCTVRRRGRHTVIVRYLTEVKTVQLTTPLRDERVDLSGAARRNWVDDEILETLERLHLPPSPQAPEAARLRRVCLDLTGRLPSPETQRSYLRDEHPDAFERLVVRLLKSPEFEQYWSYQLARLLRIQAQPKDTRGAAAFHTWVRNQLRTGRGWDDMAAQLLTAEGDVHEIGPANFYLVAGDARGQAEYASELLMGSRLRCANCHNHPLDRWTQDDYHGLAAIFARIERGQRIRLVDSGQVIHPGTGEPARAKIPGGPFLDNRGDGRAALAEWLTAPENPLFAKAMVNRLWKQLMGRGLIEPTDDLRATNPATHPRLLARLAADFVAHDFDLRHTIRLLVTSATYSRSSRTTAENAMDDRFYAHAIVRPLEPEVLADALDDITGHPEQYGQLPPGTRAVSLVDPATPSRTLDVLGRCDREDSCETAQGPVRGLSTQLHLLNGPLLNEKLVSRQGRLQQLLEAGKTNREIVVEFYERALCRAPAAAEWEYWQNQLDERSEKRREQLEDFLWSLLNSREFRSNQ